MRSSRLPHRPVVLAAVGLALLASAPASGASRRNVPPAEAVSPAASVVAPNVIGFETDSPGAKAEPFTSSGNPTVHFVDSVGDDLFIQDDAFGETNGQGLYVLSDDASALVLLFDVPTRRLSLLFGNDEPTVAQVGDRATLTVFRNGRRIDREHVVMNRNNVADQTIQYRGRVAIDRATFVYNRAGTPLDLIEVVDDITLSQVCAIRGNNRRNRLAGNASPNGICGFGGADRIRGRGGNDALFGGGGPDRIDGNDGNDLVSGGGGDDTLRTTDGLQGNDIVYGGPGNDTCITEDLDFVVSCEDWLVE